MKEFFITTVYQPLYNLLILLIDMIPGHGVFWATILLTIIVKVILMPLAKKAMISQIKMKGVQEKIKDIQEKFKDNKEELTKRIIELYKTEGVNPLSPILLILIQLPIILSLYFIFKSGLPVLNTEIIYGFIPTPEKVSMIYLGLDLAGKSLVLAILTGLTQFFYIKRTFAKNNESKENKNSTPTKAEEFQKALSFQFTYIMPFIIAIIAYTLPAVISIYWITSNIFAYMQDIYIRNHTDKLGIS